MGLHYIDTMHFLAEKEKTPEYLKHSTTLSIIENMVSIKCRRVESKEIGKPIYKSLFKTLHGLLSSVLEVNLQCAFCQAEINCISQYFTFIFMFTSDDDLYMPRSYI